MRGTIEIDATRRMFSAPEVAKLLGCRHEQILNFIRSGELQAVDFSRKGSSRPRYRIAQSAIDAFLERRTVRPPAAPAPRRKRETTGKQWV